MSRPGGGDLAGHPELARLLSGITDRIEQMPLRMEILTRDTPLRRLREALGKSGAAPLLPRP